MAGTRPRRHPPGLDHVEDVVWLAPGTRLMVLGLGLLAGAGYGIAHLLGA